MQKVILFLISVSLVLNIIVIALTAFAHQSEYSECAKRGSGAMYALGNQKGWRTACKPGDTLVQQREVIRTATCSLNLLGMFPIALCSCETGEVAAFSRIVSTTPTDLTYNYEIVDVTEWMPNLIPPEQHLLIFATPKTTGGQLEIEYTCTSH